MKNTPCSIVIRRIAFGFPDIFIDKAQALRVPSYVIQPSYLRVYKSGKMSYSARVNYDVACEMNFEAYPVTNFLFNVL